MFFFAVSSIFTVPNVRLQPETGESMRVFGKNNSYGKGVSNSKHWRIPTFTTDNAGKTWLLEGVSLKILFSFLKTQYKIELHIS